MDDDTDVVNYVVQYRLPTHPFTESINFQDDNPLWNLMQGCWNKHPNLRPTAVEVAREVTRVKAALAQFQLAKQFLNMSVSTPKEDKGDDSDGEGYV